MRGEENDRNVSPLLQAGGGLNPVHVAGESDIEERYIRALRLGQCECLFSCWYRTCDAVAQQLDLAGQVSRQDRLILDNQYRDLAHEYQDVGEKRRQYMSDTVVQGLGKPLVFFK